ncbi:NADH:flavin oxidoreductase [Paraburkholderia rhynchosiae]|uniref:12-oxophytodienoate reductase n=1 Tax=Paraburkholderia rhynchosiae TaxID=487049 RepID=A0A2N7W7X8_9BURK|nr:NADH:flavin oxidoreductase [Paraburkholderia rhynchosiae]PMS25505.1 12-oxophytodienoate reductase [Paraburkholderia rhynchosiae]CAB3733722.1 NADH oxidase [Paraburkholderia rhynchosiae]
MSHADTSTLFRPFSIRSLKLKNRIVMAPMTRLFAPEGVPGDANVAYYRRRAEGHVGLILSEGTVVDRPASRNDGGIPLFHGEPALAGWKQVIDAVHDAGGKMAPQLWHTGSTMYLNGWEPDAPVESPSALIAPGQPRGVAMTEEDIADTVAAFAKAAVEAKRLGFDTVELHGAHGYLVDQFFWSGTNLRDDRYNGPTIKERSRFAGEIVAAVREAVGPDYPIIMRFSQWKQQDLTVKLAETPAAMEDWLLPLVDAGVDILHCSQRRFWEPEFPEIDGENGLNFAGWAKKVTGAPTISVGSVGLDKEFATAFAGEGSIPASLDRLIERMERDEFDLIAVGRAILNDPNWVKRVEHGEYGALKGFDPAALAELI